MNYALEALRGRLEKNPMYAAATVTPKIDKGNFIPGEKVGCFIDKLWNGRYCIYTRSGGAAYTTLDTLDQLGDAFDLYFEGKVSGGYE